MNTNRIAETRIVAKSETLLQYVRLEYFRFIDCSHTYQLMTNTCINGEWVCDFQYFDDTTEACKAYQSVILS